MDLNREELEKLCSVRDELSNREMLDFLLVITSCRPACLIMDPEDGELDLIESFCKDLDFETSLFHDKGSSMLGSKGLFIYRDKSRFHLIENSFGRFYGLDDRDVGDFLGFPEEDIMYFHDQIKESPVEPETREKIDSMKKEGLLTSDEAKIVGLVSYVPKPSQKAVLRALESSKSYLESIDRFDEQNGTEFGKNIVESFLGVTVESLQDLV